MLKSEVVANITKQYTVKEVALIKSTISGLAVSLCVQMIVPDPDFPEGCDNPRRAQTYKLHEMHSHIMGGYTSLTPPRFATGL